MDLEYDKNEKQLKLIPTTNMDLFSLGEISVALEKDGRETELEMDDDGTIRCFRIGVVDFS
jgi:hypothetical protein